MEELQLPTYCRRSQNVVYFILSTFHMWIQTAQLSDNVFLVVYLVKLRTEP